MVIQKDVYRLKHAGILANDKITQYLVIEGYDSVKFTPGLWSHDGRNIYSPLCVNDFLSSILIKGIHTIS